ncbi:MAG TPA: hypothetical protein VGR12_03085, partial [Solirubrobacteraceae bacterium]|nr:hypothetical protein [Solirubrobacteraceae bacterium]
LPPCAELPPNAGSSGSVTCTTGTVLTIADQGQPLVLPKLEARVVDVTRAGESVDVRLRLLNRTQSSQSLDRRLYLSVAGQRYYASAEPIPGVTKRTLSLSFPVGDTTARTADLGVVPVDQPVDGKPRHLGVVHLSLPPA